MNYSDKEKKEIAQTILDQIGNKALIMIGAKNFGYTSEGSNVTLTFLIMPNPRSIKYIKITYMVGEDLYNMEFLSSKGIAVKEIEGIYGDQLKDMIKEYTSLSITLGSEDNTKQLSSNFFRDIIEKVEPSILIDYLAQAYFDKAKKFSVAKGSIKGPLYSTAYKKLLKVSSDMFDIE